MTVLIINHLFSFAVVMVAWWNTHLTAASREPLSRLSALGYGAVAILTLAVAFYRHFDIPSEWMAVAYKASVVWLFTTIALRKQHRVRRREGC
jgi:hypothetical protein